MICAPGTYDPHDRVIWYAGSGLPGLRRTVASALAMGTALMFIIDPEQIRAWRLP